MMMAQYIMGTGRMISHMDGEYTIIIYIMMGTVMEKTKFNNMAHFIKGNGRKGSNKAKGYRNIKMALSIKEILVKVINMGKVS